MKYIVSGSSNPRWVTDIWESQRFQREDESLLGVLGVGQFPEGADSLIRNVVPVAGDTGVLNWIVVTFFCLCSFVAS